MQMMLEHEFWKKKETILVNRVIESYSRIIKVK